MLSTGIKQMLRAFDNVDPVVRFKEIYLACLPPVEMEYTSGRLPEEWNPLDVDGSIAGYWRKMLPEQRQSVYKDFSDWDRSLSLDSYNRLLALITPFVRVPKPQVSLPVQPLQLSSVPSDFPPEWVVEDSSSRLRRRWFQFTEREKIAVKSRVAGMSTFDELWDGFQAIAQHQSANTGSAARASSAEPEVTSAESSSSSSSLGSSESSEDFQSSTLTVKRIVQEVVNIRYDRSSDSVSLQIRFEEKGVETIEWINAANALQPDVLVALRATMIKLSNSR